MCNKLMAKKCQELYNTAYADGRESMKEQIRSYMAELFDALNNEIEHDFNDYAVNRQQIDVNLNQQAILIQLMAEIRRF